MIRYDLRDDVAWITIDRPEKRNALHLDGWDDLRAALSRASDEARVAVVTGAGDAFCAGDDVATLAELDDEAAVRALSDRLYEGLHGVEALSVPVIAAVNGLAYGGGFELVAAADLAVAVEGATFALPETRIGAYPPYAVARVGDLCGKKRLMELALTGEPIDAATAREWGLVNRVVPAEELSDAVGTLVDRILESPAPATRLAKAYAAVALADADERERIAGGFARVAAAEDCRDATRAFLER
ncbi:enoyl-CoA hydratase/isomerase family protein [Halomarina pelagica]|uniref:enoyl-CoA hydratase/isomerase family protein n=1 Tax=Halomarina pelagica TaxID=2961599 RepID=UPI0020C44948|nr:enoyl-CoA hydratase/isomerase family protein [Halomarina sp. BND7]